MHRDTWRRLLETETQSEKSMGTGTCWTYRRTRFNTTNGRIRRFQGERTSCPWGTRCPADQSRPQPEGRCRIRLFRDHNLDSAFSPQYVNADIIRMTFKREINYSVSNPEILDLNVLQERR